jgi:hypothetical protein
VLSAARRAHTLCAVPYAYATPVAGRPNTPSKAPFLRAGSVFFVVRIKPLRQPLRWRKLVLVERPMRLRCGIDSHSAAPTAGSAAPTAGSAAPKGWLGSSQGLARQPPRAGSAAPKGWLGSSQGLARQLPRAGSAAPKGWLGSSQGLARQALRAGSALLA